MEKVKENIKQPEEAPIDGAAPAELTVTETSATVAPASKSRQWMQSKYADEEWMDDEAYEERLASHLVETDEKLASYAESDERLARILDLNPDFALVLDAMDKGMPFGVALRRYAGDIFTDEPQEGDDDFEAYKEAAEKFLAEKKKTDEEIATRKSNIEKSDAVLTEFVERNFPTEQEQVDFVEYLRSTLRNIGMGELSENFFDMIYKAYMHDKDVEDAKEAGAIEARNEKITAKRIKAATETDGMPIGGSSSPIVEEEEPEYEDSIDEVLNRRRKSIF